MKSGNVRVNAPGGSQTTRRNAAVGETPSTVTDTNNRRNASSGDDDAEIKARIMEKLERISKQVG